MTIKRFRDNTGFVGTLQIIITMPQSKKITFLSDIDELLIIKP